MSYQSLEVGEGLELRCGKEATQNGAPEPQIVLRLRTGPDHAQPPFTLSRSQAQRSTAAKEFLG